MARMPGQPMPPNQRMAMMAKQKMSGKMPTMPTTHVANMMGGPMFGHLGRFQSPSILMAGHNTTKWIQGAVKHPGAFTKKANAAGMGVQAYAAKVTKPGSTASTQTKRQGNLAKTFKKMGRGR